MQRSQGLTLEAQRFCIQAQDNSFKVIKFVRQKEIICEGYLQSSPLHKKYRVRITYRHKERPDVTLPDENFENRPPHTFQDGSLCLYHSKGLGTWRPSKPISQIIPMTAHWLWCYEMWKATGRQRWYGEEYPHAANERKER